MAPALAVSEIPTYSSLKLSQRDGDQEGPLAPLPLFDGIGCRTFVQLEHDCEHRVDATVTTLALSIHWTARVDLDLAAVLFDENLNVIDIVHHSHSQSSCTSITHTGDIQTSDSNGAQELIHVNLDTLPPNVASVIFAVCIYTYDVFFNDVGPVNVEIRRGDSKQNSAVGGFQLPEISCQSQIAGMLRRVGNSMHFKALGARATGRSIAQLLRNPSNLQCLSCSRANPSAPCDITLRIIGAFGLSPRSDERSESSRSPNVYFNIRFREHVYFLAAEKERCESKWTSKESFRLGTVTDTESATIRIAAFDRRPTQTDTLLGDVQIPAATLFNRNVGEHDLTLKLTALDDESYSEREISGSIQLRVTINETEIQLLDT